MLLEMKGVKKKIRNTSILEEFSMGLKKNEILCILGPSGCGKSTTLNLIAGLIEADKGKIINKSKKTGYVFQEDRLLEWKDIYENISMVDKTQSKERILQLIEKVGLKGFESYYPRELSGGMRQRCSIARAFNYGADLLLMDEPFKSLDYNLRLQMLTYLIEIWKIASNSIIFVTHEIDEALLLGDRIAVFSKSPTRVIKEFNIDQPRNRRRLNSTELANMRREIINVLGF